MKNYKIMCFLGKMQIYHSLFMIIFRWAAFCYILLKKSPFETLYTKHSH